MFVKILQQPPFGDCIEGAARLDHIEAVVAEGDALRVYIKYSPFPFPTYLSKRDYASVAEFVEKHK